MGIDGCKQRMDGDESCVPVLRGFAYSMMMFIGNVKL